MQVNPGAMGGQPAQQQQMASPDQLVQSLMPVVNEAMKIFDAGVSLPSVLRETATAAYLMGRGMAPGQAVETVLRWRLSGGVPALIRAQRAETGTATAQGTVQVEAVGRERQGLVPLVEQFMRDEASAAVFYAQLADQVQDAAVRDYIRHAMEDEQKHYRMLGDLYRQLTGRTYEARPEPPAVPDLLTGLKRAMDDEYEAMEQYRDVYLKSRDQNIRNLFFELMTDELEHATRFNYALQVLARPQ